MTPGAYLRGIAGARALYLWLYEDAVGMLPPPLEDAAHDLASHAPLGTIAARINVSRSTVRRDLVRLVEWGWVRDEGARIVLGRRVGATPHLLADLAAEQHTGQPDTVSRLVLRFKPEVKAPIKGKPEPTQRGTNRTWEGMDDTWGSDGKAAD